MKEIHAVPDWRPTTIYEPIPVRVHHNTFTAELPMLLEVLPHIDILSPNADEALSLLSLPLPPTKAHIEEACSRFLAYGVGQEGRGHVVIRSGGLGACVSSRDHAIQWVDALWTSQDKEKIVDVTGAGNSFLGGLSAGLHLTDGDVMESVFYASVSASYTIEQLGLPKLAVVGRAGRSAGHEEWNGDSPKLRLERLKARHG